MSHAEAAAARGAHDAVAHAHVAIGSPDSGQPESATWGIATEAPIAITMNGAAWTVMLGSPADVEDLAVGLALTERVVTDARAVSQVTVTAFLRDITVDLTVREEGFDPAAIRPRSLIGNSACGFCGLESLAQLHRLADSRAASLRDGGPRASGVEISDAAILSAYAALPTRQPINQATHSVHAAAWCEPDGTIALVREDVGRHNALDKLIGALARRDMLSQEGFIVMSSRCSYELVYKASTANCLLLATISAPTSMALEWSRALHLPVVCRSGAPPDARVVRFLSEADSAG